MKSLGEGLKAAREERGISIEQATHETNISRKFLEALEREEFNEFPAEAYLIGFLRTYSEFLGLDSNKSVQQYRNYKLSEEPTPIEQLVGPPRGTAMRKILPWAALALVLGVGGFFGIPRLITFTANWRAARVAQAELENQVPPAREVRPDSPLWEGEIRPSDTLILEDNGADLRFDVGENNNRLQIDGGSAGSWLVMLGEEIYIPGVGGRPTWRFYLKDYGLPGGGGIVEIQHIGQAAPEDDFIIALDSQPPSGQSERRRETQVILSAASPDQYTLDIEFRDFSLFRYKVDNQDPLEDYYSDGDTLRLNVARAVILWVSNAGGPYMKVRGSEISLGRRGEVAVHQIRWIANDESGAYDLSLVPLY